MGFLKEIGLYVAVILLISSCEFTQKYSQVSDEFFPGLSRLNDIQSVELVNSNAEVSAATSVEVKVVGVRPKDRVKLYSDSTCKSLILENKLSKDFSKKFTTFSVSNLPIGVHQFFAKRFRGISESICSTTFARFERLSNGIMSITPPASKTYGVSSVLSFALKYTTPVTVTGTPRVSLDLGGSVVNANYASGNGSDTLIFRVSVPSGITDSNGIRFNSNVIDLNGGTLVMGTTDLRLEIGAVVPDMSSVLIDSTIPTTSLANDGVAKKSKTWSFNCNKPSCTYQYVVDQNATTTTGLLSGTSAAQGSGDGTYYLHLKITDSYGNTSPVYHVSTLLDNTAPVLSQTALAVNGSNIYGSGGASVTWGGPCETGLTLTVSGADSSTAACSSGTWSYTTSTQSLPNLFTYNFTQQDVAGNSTTITKKWQKYVSSNWDMSASNQYSFDTNYVEVSAGAASLKQVNQSFTGSLLNQGNHIGTFVDTLGNLSLRATSSGQNIKEILPNRASNLIAYYEFEGNFNDSSGKFSNVNAAVLGNTALNADHQVGGQSAYFDGTSGDALNILPAVKKLLVDESTFSMWIKREFTTIPSWGRVFLDINNAENRVLLYCAPDGALSLGGSVNSVWNSLDPGVKCNDAFPLGEWTHLAVSIDAATTTAKIYINGALIKSGSYLPRGGNYTNATISSNSGAASWQGNIDDFALFDTPLAESQIESIYEAQKSNYQELSPSWMPKASNLLAYYKFDGNLLDSSGNGLHGTTSNSPTYSTVTKKVGSQSASFNGSTNIVHLPAGVSPWGGNFSVSFWANANNLHGGAAEQMILYNESYQTNGFRLRGVGAGKIGFNTGESGGNYGVQTGVLNSGRWNYITLTYDKTNTTTKIYLDGKLQQSNSGGTYIAHTGSTSIGLGGSWKWDGFLDDFAIFNSVLTQNDISEIYNHQKQKYVGIYESPIVDLGASGVNANWSDLQAITTLPFMKNLPGASGSESSLDYSSLVGSSGSTSDNDLMSGLVGYWPLDEVSYNGTAGEVKDYSGQGRDGSITGTVSKQTGKINEAAQILSDSNKISFPSPSGSSNPSHYLTISFWFKQTGSVTDWNIILSKVTGARGWFIQRRIGTNMFHFRFDTDGGYNQQFTSVANLFDYQWHHISLTINNGAAVAYIDGKQDSQKTIAMGVNGIASSANIETADKASANYLLDDIAIWNRALHPSEIEQLYRRGANRIKYQVRSCNDSLCAGEAWLGPDGSSGSSFSELENCSTIDVATGKCNGTVNTSSPNFRFTDFVSAPINNQYFQYKVMMEADDNTLCTSGTKTCLPEIKTINLLPNGRYFGGIPSMVTTNPISFNKVVSINFTESGSCTPQYQLSTDGSTYYYFDGTSWGIATNSITQANTKTEITSNLSSFSPLSSPGSLYIRIFLPSDLTQACSVSNIEVVKY